MNRTAALTLAIGGCLAMAAAVGIGRFIYTPALPLMSAATGLGPKAAGWIASANFAGYLAGALIAALPGFSARARFWMAAALTLSAATTGLMAMGQSPAVWALLRFSGGLASAFVLVFASALVTARLKASGHGHLTSVHFAGVGLGIFLSSLIASPWLVPDDGWREIWLLGGGATLLALIAALSMIPRAKGLPASNAPPDTGHSGLTRLVIAYGCLGFGYVITATFIVAILRESGSGRTGEALVWAMVGLAAIPSVACWSWLARRIGGIRAYQLAMGLEATGVAISTLGTTMAMMLAALLLGGTFMGLTALGLQEAARRSGGDGRAIMALMTASFGAGQMIGPALAGWLRDTTGSFTLPSLIAAAILFLGAALLQPIARKD